MEPSGRPQLRSATLLTLSLGVVLWPRLGDLFSISKSLRSLCVSFSRTDSEYCICDLFVWSKLIFSYNPRWITFPTQSYQVLYSFCTHLLHSLIIRLIFSSPHNQYLLLLLLLLLLRIYLTSW